jgi:hypothetical protein
VEASSRTANQGQSVCVPYYRSRITKDMRFCTADILTPTTKQYKSLAYYAGMRVVTDYTCNSYCIKSVTDSIAFNVINTDLNGSKTKTVYRRSYMMNTVVRRYDLYGQMYWRINLLSVPLRESIVVLTPLKTRRSWGGEHSGLQLGFLLSVESIFFLLRLFLFFFFDVVSL